MSDGGFTESVVEGAALAWLESRGYAIKHHPKTGEIENLEILFFSTQLIRCDLLEVPVTVKLSDSADFVQ